MALLRDLSRSQMVFQVEGGQPDDYQVIRYSGTEGLSQLYRFEIQLASTLESVAFDDVVGKPAVLSVNDTLGENPRWFHGVVSRFELTGETVDLLYYRVELVPEVWLLTHRYGSRIFQNKTAKEIITAVLTDAGIASDRVSFQLSPDPPRREYCVQYRETDYNFICRLMEEEGIWWYFEQTEEAHKLVMANSTAAYVAWEGDPLPYLPASGMNVTGERISRFRLGQSVRPGAVVLNDFNWQNPPLPLQAKATSGRDEGLEFFDYPGEYFEQARGTSLATMRAEEFECGRTMGVGQSNSYKLSPAHVFAMSGHRSQATDGEYVLTRITHSGRQSVARTNVGTNGDNNLLDARVSQSLHAARQSGDETVRNLAEALLSIASKLGGGDPTAHRALSHWLFHAGQVARDATSAVVAGDHPLDALTLPNLIDDVLATGVMDLDGPVYENRFECIPAVIVYRPPRITPWPVVRGSQSARVVGPSGEEIYTDEYGRIKVQFDWDREGEFNENSSCWIRVCQGMAGGGYGMLFLPRVGQEVIVDFLNGDPDQPIIIGRVYNKDHMPPYTLPDEKTKSVIKTHSSKGGGGTNEIRFEDAKDSEQILLYAQKDLHVRVNNDRVENVGANRHLTVGNNKIEKVAKDSDLEIGQDCKALIKRDHNLEIKGKESIKVIGTSSREVQGDVVEKYGANHKHEVQTTYAVKATSIKLEASSGIELKCGGSSVVISPSAVFIVGGPLVNINSGSGPPVSPVSAGATAPAAPEAPLAADKATPGQDTTYSGGEQREAAEARGTLAGHQFEEDETEEEDSTWIDLKLVDEEGNPCAGEEYRIIDSKGKEHKGSLDSNGEAHVIVPKGQCDITYPRLDNKSWQRTV